jgi:hypothetical protein
MGILPLQHKKGENREKLGLDGTEVYDISGLSDGVQPGEEIPVVARKADGTEIKFTTIARIDSPIDKEYLRHGGILQMVLRNLMRAPAPSPAVVSPQAAAVRGGSATAGAGGGNRHRSGGRNAPLLFEQLRQLGRLEDGELRQVVYDLCQISHFSVSFKGSNRCFGDSEERPHAASSFRA